VAGGGGLGGEIVQGLVHKGAGEVHVADFDHVTPSNLNRQPFGAGDLWRNKAVQLCRIMSRRGWLGTRLFAYPCRVQEVMGIQPDLVIAGVDNQLPSTRLDVCAAAARQGIPAVIAGVTPDADSGYVHVYEPQGSCWVCAYGASSTDGAEERCPESAASVDILKVLAGVALYAADSVLMSRPRDWNYWSVSLRRAEYGGAALALRRPDCPVCGIGRAT